MMVAIRAPVDTTAIAGMVPISDSTETVLEDRVTDRAHTRRARFLPTKTAGLFVSRIPAIQPQDEL
jgi:hypothetical protein